MSRMSREELADDLGYQSARCPKCRRHFYNDSPGDGCPFCGHGAQDDTEEILLSTAQELDSKLAQTLEEKG